MTATRRLLIVLLSLQSLFLLTGARSRTVRAPHIEPRQLARDAHSFSNPQEAVVRHITLDLEVDFDARLLRGTAQLDITNLTGASKIVLDSRDLNVESVTVDGRPVLVSFGPFDPILGSSLSVPIESGSRQVTILYRTSPDARALTWAEASQTFDKKHPFLYSQNEPIDARSWIPTQDSPAVRVTYDATIRTRPELLALMSAENPTRKSNDGVYRFTMRTPIPSYLIALAVGDLEFRSIDERTGVYAEPGMIEAARYELDDTPKMLAAAEKMAGPYRWDRYDLLIMPPSYQLGGMEHARLTFVTPSFIAGDRSLVSLIAHELGHSWSGNQVTTSTWNDVWLNEGMAVYFERRIMEEVYGRDFSEMLAYGPMQSLRGAMSPLNPDTRLHGDYTGRDPIGTFSFTAYEKGYAFMRMLEEGVGREAFDAFLRSYFSTFAFQWMDARSFEDFFRRALLSGTPGLESRLLTDAWIHAPGLPDNAPTVISSRFRAVDQQLGSFEAGTPIASLNTSGWSAHEIIYFLTRASLGAIQRQMAGLDATFHLSQSTNLRVLYYWVRHVILASYVPGEPAVERYLLTAGSGGSLRAVYSSLLAMPGGREKAIAIYARARPGYHRNVRSSIDALLGQSGKRADSEASYFEKY